MSPVKKLFIPKEDAGTKEPKRLNLNALLIVAIAWVVLWGVIAFIAPEAPIVSLLFGVGGALFVLGLVVQSWLDEQAAKKVNSKAKKESIDYRSLIKALIVLFIGVFICVKIVQFCGWFIATFGMVAFLLLLVLILK